MGNVPPSHQPNPFRRDNSWFQPGMNVPRSGLYQVHHDAHREAHAVMAIAGNKFPGCRHCGDRVQFAPLFAGEPIERDGDLAMSDSMTA